MLRESKTDNPTIISAHPNNGHNISNLRCLKFAVLTFFRTILKDAPFRNVITFAGPHEVSQFSLPTRHVPHCSPPQTGGTHLISRLVSCRSASRLALT